MRSIQRCISVLFLRRVLFLDADSGGLQPYKTTCINCEEERQAFMQRPALILMEKQFVLNPVDSGVDEPSAWMMQTSLWLIADLPRAAYIASGSPPVRVSMLGFSWTKPHLPASGRASWPATIEPAYQHAQPIYATSVHLQQPDKRRISRNPIKNL
jgi:hypothetical protein